MRGCFNQNEPGLAVFASSTDFRTFLPALCVNIPAQVFAREFDFTPRVWSGKAVGHFKFKARSREDSNVNSNDIFNDDRGTLPDFRVDYVSELTSFKQFVSECSRYQGLQLVSAQGPSANKKDHKTRPKKQLMVLEQLPLLHHAPTKIAVQRILAHFAEKSTTPGTLPFEACGCMSLQMQINAILPWCRCWPIHIVRFRCQECFSSVMKG